MKIVVNGQQTETAEKITVRALLELLGYTEGPVAVEINREVVPRATHPEHMVCEGDVVEIVHFVGGG